MDTLTARKRLEQMCGDLDSSISVLRNEHSAAQGGMDSPQDPADVGTTLADTSQAEAMLAAAQSQRSAVLDALARLDHGTYGLCGDCASPIPEGRLDARPEAARCVSCQSKRDRRH